MADLGHQMTDKELEQLERKIHRTYKEAYKEMQDKVDAYFDKLKDRDKEQQALLETGKITKKQYEEWRLTQYARGERYRKLRDEFARRMNEANKVAAAYVNDTTPGIYSLNANYMAYTIEQSGAGVDFNLIQEQAVRRLIVEEPELFHHPAIDTPLDVVWNRRKLTDNLTAGILMGESTRQIADRFQKVTDMNRTSALRNARTAVTGAQNAGRQATYDRAREMGLKLDERWLSTKDGVTRDSHRVMDGKPKDKDGYYHTPLGSIMRYPGDMQNGKAADVYNCRCTTTTKDPLEAEPTMMRARDPVTGRNEVVPAMTYQEWYEWKEIDDKDAFTAELLNKNRKAAEEVKKEEVKKSKAVDPYSFTDEQSEAIEWYVSGEGQYINQYHRGRVGSDFGELREEEKRFSELLDEATDRVLPDDIKSLYRSVDARAIFGDIDSGDWYDIESAVLYNDKFSQKKVQSMLDKTKGKTIAEKGFMSTTKNLDVAEEWGDFTGAEMPLTLEFDDIPKGLKGADLKRFDVDGDEQFEVLLARGTRYEITDIYAKNGQVHVKAKFLVDDVAEVVEEAADKNIVKEVVGSKYNTKTISSQFKMTEALNEYDYYEEEQESFRLSAIQEMSGVDDEKARKYLDALCGQRDDYIRARNSDAEYRASWFYGADREIRAATSSTFLEKAETIHDYIVRSPKYEGEIYRGLSLSNEQIQGFQKGGIFEENGLLSSWTSSMDVADMFAQGRSEELGLTPVIIKTKNPQYGTPVSHLSIFGQEEQEVLVSNMEKKQYTIGDISEKDGVVIIELLG